MKRERYIIQDVNTGSKETWSIWTEKLVMNLLFITGLLAVVFCFISNVRAREILAAVGVLTSVYLNLGIKIPGISRWRNLPLVLAGVLCILFSPAGFYRGFLYWLNQWLTVWNERFGTYIALFAVGEVTIAARVQVLIILVLAGVLLIHFFIEKGSLVLASSLMVLLFALSSVVGIAVPFYGILAVLLGWMGVWIHQMACQEQLLKRLIFFVPAGLFLLACFVGTSEYQGSMRAASAKKSIEQAVDVMRYGKDTLPQGNMHKAYAMEGDSREKTLEISCEEAQEMYLRGFVGSSFDGERWNTMDKEAYHGENEGILKWLAGKNFNIDRQYSVYQELSSKDAAESQQMTVENVGAYRKYLYLPYMYKSLTKGNGRETFDWQMQSKGLFGEKEYAFRAISEDTPTEYMVRETIQEDKAGASDYEQAENIYRNFVYENYLEVPEDEKQLIEDTFFGGQDWSDAELYQVTTQIRLVLQGLVNYQEQPDRYDGSLPFLSWFFENAKSGNSAYYATVAALAYREAGIPARYVEGYYVSNSDAAEYRKEKETTLTLTEKNTHAWVEIYMDGIGWLPMETVPGFYIADYTTQQILDAPKSSVNIQDENTEEELKGSTADQLPGKEEQKKKEQVVKRTIQILGILALVSVLIWLLHALLELERGIRIRSYERKIKKEDSADSVRRIYGRICKVLQIWGACSQTEFPKENEAIIREFYGELLAAEYHQAAAIVQKTVFGEIQPSVAEYTTVKAYSICLTEQVYADAGQWKRFLMKYRYAVR